MNNTNQFINTLNDLIGDIHIRIDAKQMIAELRACQNNYVYLDINTKNLTHITIRDNTRRCTIKTKN